MDNISLLGSTSRVEVPFIKVTFGSGSNAYSFGVYQKTTSRKMDEDGFYEAAKIVYPNYIKSLNITKINGQVNQYTLNIAYPITATDDPNFFEKVFSSVSKTRKITFSYGDISLPTFIYKEEEALITNIKTQFNIQNSVINYTISAVSSANLLSIGAYKFTNVGYKKPSDEIKKLLSNPKYGLKEIFYGMNDIEKVISAGLIPGNDKEVILESKNNISVLDYLLYLVSCMVPASNSFGGEITSKTIYILTIVDDITGEFGGPYFKITPTTKDIEASEAYEIDIGYPTSNIVISFSIDNQENYSIYYDWQKQLNDKEYIYRINDQGEWEEEYAPIISSKNEQYKTRVDDRVWWTKVTEYPISAQITIKGLLRPAILMSYVRLRVYFFGWEHISSGLYIITKQQDSIDENSGYRTTLNLTRVSKAE